MQITQLDAQTYVGPQISIANLNDLKRLNVKTVVVARPEERPLIRLLYPKCATPRMLWASPFTRSLSFQRILRMQMYGHFVLSHQRRIIQFLSTAVVVCARPHFGR